MFLYVITFFCCSCLMIMSPSFTVLLSLDQTRKFYSLGEKEKCEHDHIYMKEIMHVSIVQAYEYTSHIRMVKPCLLNSIHFSFLLISNESLDGIQLLWITYICHNTGVLKENCKNLLQLKLFLAPKFNSVLSTPK